MTAEKFRKKLSGKVVSSAGFSVRVASPSVVEYEDAHGALRIDAEDSFATNAIDVVLYSNSIPDEPARPRAVVTENVRRAFEYAGWGIRIQ